MIPALTLISPSVHLQRIEFKNLKNNPGLLPFKLGNARIQISEHTFIHKVALHKFESEIQNYIDQFDKINSVIKNYSVIHPTTENNQRLIYAQLHRLVNSFELIKPESNITSRSKRGLINGLGSVFKFISGNLDSSDGEKYEKAIHQLKNSQNNIVRSFNRQLSLNKQAMQTIENSFKIIDENQQKMAVAVKEITVNAALQTRLTCLSYLSTSIMYLQEIIDNIQIALTFANINVLHPSILTTNDIKFMLSTLSNFHDPSAFYFDDYQSFINTISINYYITNDHIVFALHVALLHPIIFHYYKLYSVPTENNTVIVSPSTYIAMTEDLCEYVSRPCRLITQNYFCARDAVVSNYQQDNCISHLLQVKEYPNCTAIPVTVNQPIVEQVNEAKYIIIAPTPIRIKAKCKSEEIKTLQGTYLVEVPYQCQFTAKDFTYENLQEEIPEEPVYLPKLNLPAAAIQPMQLNLKNVPLDQLHRLTIQQAIPLQEVKQEDVWIHSSIPIYACVLFTIVALIIYWYYSKCNRIAKTSNREDGNEADELVQTTSSTFFAPKGSA